MLDFAGMAEDFDGVEIGMQSPGDVDSSKARHYFYDANGSVEQVVDCGDGSIAAAYQYAVYGNLIDSSGGLAGDNPYRFSTKQFYRERLESRVIRNMVEIQNRMCNGRRSSPTNS